MKGKMAAGVLASMMLVTSLGIPSQAFAASTQGRTKSITVSGVTYSGYTTTVSSGSRVTGASNVRTSSTVGAGYIYTLVSLYEGGTSAGAAAGYNSVSSSFGSSSYYTGGRAGYSYHTKGSFGGFNPTSGSYVQTSQYASPSLMFYASALSSTMVPEEPIDLAEIAYGVTSEGETYGSGLGEEVFGELPDWITALATNGAEGYIKADDYWVPQATCPADAVENFSERRVRSIPVYAEPGSEEIVGQYDMYYGG